MPAPQTEVLITVDGVEYARHLFEPGDYVIGRNPDCKLRVDADLVSREHARLIINFDHALIEDLGSSNGTFVNDAPVTERTRLWSGQKIRIGAAIITLRRLQGEALSDMSLAPAQRALRDMLPAELLREKKYDIGAVVARGGMGAILDAREAAIQRKVAMKVMLDTNNADSIARFVAEAQVTGQLEHPNIVPVHELSVDENGQPFYTMQMVRGITLKKVLELLAKGTAETVKKFPLSALLTVFQKVCDAIAFAHSKGVIHRDLKPENIMLGDFGSVLVMDWGLAKVLGKLETHTPGAVTHSMVGAPRPDGTGSATLAGSIMGTPAYMAPEQARGEVGTMDQRADIYALGGILFHMLFLRPSVSGSDAMQIVGKVARGELEWSAPTDVRTVPDSLLAVSRKALASDPAARYGSVEDLQADVLAYQNGFATSAEKAGAWKQVTLFVKRNKAASIGVAAVLVLSVGFTAKVITEGRRAERALGNLSKTAPTLVAEGRRLIDAQKFDDALVKIRFAVEIDPRNAGYRLLLAQLQQARLELREAADEFRRVLALGPDESAQVNLALCEKLLHDYPNAEAFDHLAWQQLYNQMDKEGRATQAVPITVKIGRTKDATETLLKARLVEWRRIPGWDRHKESDRVRWERDGSLSLVFSDTSTAELASLNLAGLPVSRLEFASTRVRDLGPLKGMPLRRLTFFFTKGPFDLSPLVGMPLEEFGGGQAKFIDLSPLHEMKLKVFHGGAPDFKALRGMPLATLSVESDVLTTLDDFIGCPISNLRVQCPSLRDASAALKMPLKIADFSDCRGLRDFKPLLECPTLEKLRVPPGVKEIGVLRTHPKLRLLGYVAPEPERPVAEFWADYDAKQAAGKK